MVGSDNTAAELAEIVREIRERVRARYPTDDAGKLRLADLMPAVHAREVAAHKVAAIGSVNPRPPGILNDAAQSLKKLISRGLGWFVRDQVEFNRSVLHAIDTLIEAQNDTNRALTHLSHRSDEISVKSDRIVEVENGLLRSIDSLQHQLMSLQTQFNQQNHALASTAHDWKLKSETQHREFTESLVQHSNEMQSRFWKEVEVAIAAQQALIHNELRLIRQRAAITPTETSANPATHSTTPQIDWMLFAQKFRGSENAIRQSFQRYTPFFEKSSNILDIGCGRGEFLELMREANVSAKGIDLSAENTALCTSKKLDVERADVFPYLATIADGSLGGIFCAQVIEHLTAAQTIHLVRLCAQKLKSGSPILFETPNPECLAIFATHFYLDPTHIRPVPPQLMAFYLEEAGFGRIEVIQVAPAEESIPAVKELPEEFRQKFFGSLDYAISARKL